VPAGTASRCGAAGAAAGGRAAVCVDRGEFSERAAGAEAVDGSPVSGAFEHPMDPTQASTGINKPQPTHRHRFMVASLGRVYPALQHPSPVLSWMPSSVLEVVSLLHQKIRKEDPGYLQQASH